jgi:hypothetical protein
MKNSERKTGSAYDTRFRYKLNMLEPGTVMLKWIGLLGVIGLVLFLLHLKTAACCVLGLSGILFLLLLVLLAIEAHQDKVLYEISMKEDTEREKK